VNIYDTTWADCHTVEHRVAQIIREQELNGWQLDIPLIKKHIETLEGMIEQIDNEVLPNIPQFKRSDGFVAEPYLKNGELKAHVKKWLVKHYGEDWKEKFPVSGPFEKVYYETINLDSDQQVKEYLLGQGWQPTEWNYGKDGEKTSPKLTEDSFDSVAGNTGKLISKRMVITHRLGVLNGLLRDARPDGRIEARANTVGTNTFRMRHALVVNIPKASKEVFFGKEIRSCFIAKPGYVLMDYDAKNLENRMMCHYVNDPAMTELILFATKEDDYHSRTWHLCEEFISSRATAKNVNYALIYGAGDKKLGTTADRRPDGWSYEQVGREIRARIMKGLPALDKLVRGVKLAARRGFLWGLDKRKLRIRSEHSALNTLFQSAGAVVMKVAMVLLDDAVREAGLDAKKVGDFHDEGIFEVLPEHAEQLAELARAAVIKAGVLLKLNLPLEADAKIGDNWAQIH